MGALCLVRWVPCALRLFLFKFRSVSNKHLCSRMSLFAAMVSAVMGSSSLEDSDSSEEEEDASGDFESGASLVGLTTSSSSRSSLLIHLLRHSNRVTALLALLPRKLEGPTTVLGESPL